MKKLLTDLVLIGGLSLSLSACGGGGGASGNPANSTGSLTAIGYAVTNFAGFSGSTQSTVLYSNGSGASASSVQNLSGGWQAISLIVKKTISGKTFVFAGTTGPDSIIAFGLDTSTGNLTQLTGITGLPYGVDSISVSKSSNYLFAELSNGEITSYSIGVDGSLSATPFNTSLSGATGDGWIVEDATGDYLVAIAQNSTTTFGVYLYQDNNDGTLTYKNESLNLSNNQGFTSFVADPNTTNGDYMYGGSIQGENSSDVFILNIGKFASGSTSFLSTYSTGLTGTESAVWWIDPTGSWIYVDACDTTGNASCSNPQTSQFNISTTGSLSPGSMAPFALQTAFSPFESGYDKTTGTVISTGDSNVAEYAFSSFTGGLTPVAKSPVNTGSVSGFLFVSN